MALPLRDRGVDRSSPVVRSSFGIRWMVVGFVLLATATLLVVLFLPPRDSETVQLPARVPGVTVPVPATGATGTGVTVPGGAAAPEGVTKVLATGGSTSFSFEVPPALEDARVRAAVPPATVEPGVDGRSLRVRVECALVREEVLAQVSVSEGDTTVTVLPVVLVPESGEVCPAGTELATTVLPLAAPLGARQVFVAPAGTPVPTPG